MYIIFVLQFVCHSWFMASYNIIVCSNVEHTSHLKYTFASCHSRYIDSSHTEIVRIGSMDVNKGYVVVYTLHIISLILSFTTSYHLSNQCRNAHSLPLLCFPQWDHHRYCLRSHELRFIRSILSLPRVSQERRWSSLWRSGQQ